MPFLKIPNYILASVAVSLGGFLNGLDTGCIGAIVTMDQFTKSIGEMSSSLLGFTVSLIMLTGTVPSIFSGTLADRYGRLRIIMVGSLLFMVGAILQGASYSLPLFLVGRALGGVGEGVFLSNISVYVCEIAPVRTRGVLTGLTQFMATTGVCFGYFLCYGTVHISTDMAWRFPYMLQAALGLLVAFICYILPDSPRWYILKGKQEAALHSLRRLDFSMVEAERDMLASGPTEQRPSLSGWQSFLLLWKRGYRARTVLALFVLGMVQLSGIDGVIYYAPTIFTQAGIPSSTASFLASGLSAILMLVISIPALLLADKWGRRTSAISGGLCLSGCMILIGSLYAADTVHSTGFARWVVIICVFVFCLTYCATWGIVGKIYASEIQPAQTRATANCAATGLGFFTNWLVAIITPILLDKSAYGAYFLFGFLALGTVLILSAYMPETRGRSLENIQEAFHRPAVKSWSHYLQHITSRLQSNGFSHRDDSNSENIALGDMPPVSTSVEPVAFGKRVDVMSA